MGAQQDMAEGPWESPSESNPWFIGIQRWNKAEKAAEGIISKFQPTIVAEKKRDSVINYLHRLLKDNLDCEVFAYGSVPLKTYLPDGDIDLSAVGAQNSNQLYLIKEIASLLESEGKNKSAKFVVKDVQLIGAEVKLVKCMVQNLVVDISVNQIGGLCTLCFLEQVDRVIKKEHLFKRSIILIKAWCYFESRTLGGHVGLISTYGLETLVLYIFHLFHLTLDGPLSVLYKFLEYFSAFDWDNYGISLMGPVRLSELPRIVVERPPNSNELLLKFGFLSHCSETLSVPMRPGDAFSRKHLNIVDPLNDHNNLGRSVSQGNFFRIRSAFSYGARKLEQLLTAPEDNINEELLAFFSNTLNMHGSGQRPDLPDHIKIPGAEKTPRTSNDENSNVSSGFPEGKDAPALQVKNHVRIPFYAPHLLFHYSKLVKEMENSEVHEEEVPYAIEDVPRDDGTEGASVNLDPSEPLDLTGDLMSHMECLEHFRWWMIRPPPPPPPILLSMIASEHGGMRFQPPSSFIPNPRATMTYVSDMNQSRHIYQTSTSNATNARRHQNPNRSPRPRSVSGIDRLVADSSYHLKDEDDFPPLSS